MRTFKLFHIYLFIFGFLYYLILPLLVVIVEGFDGYPGMQHLYKNFNPEIVFPYTTWVTIFLLSFLAGSLLPLKYSSIKLKAKTEWVIGARDIALISISFFLIGQYTIISNSNNLFKGYQVDYDTDFMGSIATLNTFFLFFLLYNKGKEQKDSGSRFIELYLILSILEFSVVLLGLGSRMYIMVPLISYIIYLIDHQKISFKKLFFRGILIILFLLGVGIWRLGDTNFSIDALLYIGVAEPVFTWISAESMFSMNNLPLLAFPSNFLTSFINFIPTILLPDKTDYITQLTILYDSPLGATNILVSLIGNFGLLGSCFALFCLGFLLSFIRIQGTSLFLKTYYYCLCGILPFQLFRDNISIVNKMLFYNFLIFPFIFLLIEKFIANKYLQKDESNS